MTIISRVQSCSAKTIAVYCGGDVTREDLGEGDGELRSGKCSQ